tara:strand:+ start:6876 stop:8276 length:1401 start_codon:yes stop_codon:yes gene_type:complete
MSNRVDEKSKAYTEMARRWDLIEDLLGGTLAMRDAQQKWLPQETQESPLAYRARLDRSYLYGAFTDTVKKLSAKPFSKPVDAKEGLTPQLEDIADDADLNGRDITSFARDIFEDGITYGLAHILIDYPAIGAGLNLAEERATGARPYFVRIKPTDLIAWQSTKQADGTEVVTQIRFKENRIEVDGFEEKVVEYIRVITETEWQLWREKDGDWLLAEEGLHSFGEVPLATFYTARDGFMSARPPLEDLAWLNLAHWQSLSDQRNILRFARMGILFASGFSEEEIEGGVTIGASQLTASTNPDAKLSYVEHSGNAIGAGEADLSKLEARMEVLGLQPLVASTGNATATARALDEAKTHSNIQAWIRGLENTLEQAYEKAGQWVASELPTDFTIDVFSDFGVTMSAGEDIKSLIAMKQAGMISHKTFLQEVKRRGLLDDGVLADDEIELAQEEAGGMLDAMPSDNDNEE